MNTNRRNFLASILTAAIAPSLLLPAILPRNERPRWKRTKEDIWILNPDYSNAPYEIAFLSGTFDGFPRIDHAHPIVLDRSKKLSDDSIIHKIAWPVRMNKDMQYVQPFMVKT